MGFRFYRRVRLAPGLSLNLSRSVPSLSMGGRGLHYTLGRHRSRATVGLPGTGLSYTVYTPQGAISSREAHEAHASGRAAGIAASQGRIAEAAEHLERYSDHVPEDPLAQTQLGVAASLGGDTEAAAFHLGNALPSIPPGDDRACAAAHLVLARVAEGDVPAAIELADQELKSVATSQAARMGLLWAAAVATWGAGDPEKALAHLNELGQLDPYLPGLQEQKRAMVNGTFDLAAAAREKTATGIAQ